MTWQAIAAFAGFFTLLSAHADPVDLWRITVLSHQGEPLRAIATLESLPGEHITDECLSLGSEADAPGSDAPLLKHAKLKLNAARTAVEIRTDAPVSSPSLELVLRVQCPGTFLYARHFSTLIPPASASITGHGIRNGFRLKVGPGETVGSLAAVVAPGNRKLQQQLVREVVAANPEAFPDAKARAIPAGTILWFPDLRSVGKSASAAPVAPPAKAVAAARPPPRAAAGASTPQTAAPKVEAAVMAPPQSKRSTHAESGAARAPVKLRQSLELGEKPGPQECRMLLPLCGVVDAAGTAPASPATGPRADGLESGIQALKLKQDSIDSQLSRLEQSLQELTKVVESRPVAITPAPAPAPKPEIRTVVKTEYKTEPIPWYLWAGILAATLVAAAGGFFYGRRRAYSDSLSDSEGRLDEMLASAADEMRDLDRVPMASTSLAKVAPPPPSVRDTDIDYANGTEIRIPDAPDMAFDKTQIMEAAPNIDAEPQSVPKENTSGESTPVVSSDLAFEMDQALDNTRSMFTDVDRFIALGRTQNALSLLQFQVVKDPKDRDSWIKLLAIYRQEKMDAELDKALREFRKNFPNDKATI
jgi:hypothetical protein